MFALLTERLVEQLKSGGQVGEFPINCTLRVRRYRLHHIEDNLSILRAIPMGRFLD